MSVVAVRLAFSPEERQRVDRVDQLTAEGGAGLDELVRMLDDPSWTVRRSVVEALAASGTAAVDPLCRSLRTQRASEARIAATVDALAAVNGNADLALVEMIAGADAPVVADIAQILGRRRTVAGLPAVIALTRHPDDNVAVAAIEALGRIGGRAAVDSLVDAVKSGNFFRTFPAIDVLGRSGDPRAVDPLTDLLDQPQFAAEAARALGRTGDIAAIVPLMTLVAHAGLSTVRIAALAVRDLHQRYGERFGNGDEVQDAIRLGANAGGVSRQLTRALGEGDAAERAAICFLLGAEGDPSSVPVLTGLLDGNEEVAREAAIALKRLGPQVEDQIVAGLRRQDSAQRRSLLPLVSSPGAAREVADCLKDADPEVRALACEALARTGATDAVGAIFSLLADPNGRVLYAAMAAIQSLGSRETEKLAIAGAHSNDPRVRGAALRIITYFGFASAMDEILGALSDPDERVRDITIQGLPFMDDPRALEALLAAAKSPLDRTRAAAMRSLGQCNGDLRVSAYLLKGITDANPWVRYYACQALGRLAFEPATDALIRSLADPAGQVRVAAVEALSHLRNEAAIIALKRAATDADSDIQRAALIGLGVAGRDEALPFMLATAKSADAATRLVAISAFAGFRVPEVLFALRDAVSDPDEGVRRSAIGFLSTTPGVATTEILVDLLRTAGMTEQLVAALAVPIEGRVEGLSAALERADDETASSLTSALARMRRPAAVSVLIGAMSMANVAARKAAATALAATATREAQSVLRRAADSDPEPEVRQICSLLLAR